MDLYGTAHLVPILSTGDQICETFSPNWRIRPFVSFLVAHSGYSCIHAFGLRSSNGWTVIRCDVLPHLCALGLLSTTSYLSRSVYCIDCDTWFAPSCATCFMFSSSSLVPTLREMRLSSSSSFRDLTLIFDDAGCVLTCQGLLLILI